MTGGLALAAWGGNRIATALAAFITTFGPWGFAFIFGAPYLGLGFWLIRAGRAGGAPGN